MSALLGSLFLAAALMVRLRLMYPAAENTLMDVVYGLATFVTVAFIVGLPVTALLVVPLALVVERWVDRRFLPLVLIGAAALGAAVLIFPLGHILYYWPLSLIVGAVWALIATLAWFFVVPPYKGKFSHG